MNTPAKFDHTSGHYIKIDDTDIYIEEQGKSDAPALIMMHGGFGTIEDFNPILPPLARHFRLIGIDSRGHGRSGQGPAHLSYKILTDDLSRVIDALGLCRFSLFGFSDGGITAYRFAAQKDSRLDKIITVGASWEMSENEPCWEMVAGMTGDIWKELFPESYIAYMRLNPDPDFDRFAELVLGMWTDLTPDGHPEQSVREISAEMLVVRGDDDDLTNPASLIRFKTMNEQVHFLNIPFADHVAFLDAPDVFCAATGRFLGVDLSDRS